MDRAIIARNDAARERLQALIGRLDNDDLGRSLGDGWTVSAMLGHLMFWDQRALVLLDRWDRDGVAPSPADVDAVNDAIRPLCLLVPRREAARAALAAAATIDRRVAALSAEQVAAIAAAGQPVNFSRSTHRDAHVDQIERALGLSSAGGR